VRGPWVLPVSLDLGVTTEAQVCPVQGGKRVTVGSTDFLADAVWMETLESLERVVPLAPPVKQAPLAPAAPPVIVGRMATTALLVCVDKTAC